MPLDPAPVGESILPDHVIESDAFRLFVAYVDHYMPQMDGTRADHAALVGWAQAVADLGLEVEEPVAAFALETVPSKENRVSLRTIATATLFPSGAPASIRDGALAHLPDVSEIPSRRERRRRARAARRTCSTVQKETP